MDKKQIVDLQTYFDGRSRLNNAITAIKCYTKSPSIFYAYVDGWNNKKTINIPIEPTDLLPILERYVENIEKEIIAIAHEAEAPAIANVVVENDNELVDYIADYKERYPDTYTSYEKIKSDILDGYAFDKANGKVDTEKQYSIPVCSDWVDKLFVFTFRREENNTVIFRYCGIYKL